MPVPRVAYEPLEMYMLHKTKSNYDVICKNLFVIVETNYGNIVWLWK